MDPLPETTEAVEEYGPFVPDGDLLQELQELSDRVLAIVPELVGMSLTLVDENITLTLAATSLDSLRIDAAQYLDGGPCVDAVHEDEVIATVLSPLAEDRWQLFSLASAAYGVASSLSLPLHDADRVVGGINLYGSTPDAFDGRHDEVGEALGARASQAVTNADLTFSTRDRARLAPQTLRDEQTVTLAVGLLARRAGIPADEARQRLRSSAVQAALTELEVARAVISVISSR